MVIGYLFRTNYYKGYVRTNGNLGKTKIGLRSKLNYVKIVLQSSKFISLIYIAGMNFSAELRNSAVSFLELFLLIIVCLKG